MTKSQFMMPNWRGVKLPQSVTFAQTMLMPTEQQMLYTLASQHFRNQGCIVDAGCFLGGSTLALAQGVSDNAAYISNRQGAAIHSYDLFLVEPWTIGLYFPVETPLGSTFEHIFRNNIQAFTDIIEVHAGDITKTQPPIDLIEILFIDCAKHWNVNDHIVGALFPRLIPGHSIVVQQDYLYPIWTGWLPITMEYYSDYFEIIDHTEKNSVAFFYHSKIPDSLLNYSLISSLSLSEMKILSDRAISRFKGEQKDILEKSANHFRELLIGIGWRA